MDRVVDLIGGKVTSSAHLHAVPVEDGAHRSPVDAEPGAQLVGCRTGGIAVDERLDLVGVELPCPPQFGPVDGQRNGCGGVGQLSEQRLQGFYWLAVS